MACFIYKVCSETRRTLKMRRQKTIHNETNMNCIGFWRQSWWRLGSIKL